MRTNFLNFLKQQEQLHEDTVGAMVGLIAERERKRSEAEATLRVGAERAERVVKLEQMYVRMKRLEIEMLNRTKLDKSAASAQHIMAAIDALRETFEKRQPLFTQVGNLRTLAEDDVFIQATLDGIPESSLLNGVQTEAQIAKSFVTLRKNVRLVEYVPEGGGMFAHLLSGAVSYITFQRRGLAQGDAPDAVMSRAEYYLDQGDLEQATIEVNKLIGVPRSEAAEWLAASRSYLETKQAVDLCHTHTSMLRMSML